MATDIPNVDPTDTTTTLNPGSGGDAMDEALVTQTDGSTQGRRPRVDLGYSTDDVAHRLVSEKHPLPVKQPDPDRAMLEQMADDLHAIRMMLESIVD